MEKYINEGTINLNNTKEICNHVNQENTLRLMKEQLTEIINELTSEEISFSNLSSISINLKNFVHEYKDELNSGIFLDIESMLPAFERCDLSRSQLAEALNQLMWVITEKEEEETHNKEIEALAENIRDFFQNLAYNPKICLTLAEHAEELATWLK